MPQDVEQADEGLIKTAVQLSRDQHQAIKALARLRQVSAAAVVREAVRDYLAGLSQKEALAA
jgi:hypothetical protein